MSTAAEIRRVRVLSASADPGLRESRELLLRHHGYVVETAVSREAALEMIESRRFDLLILGNSLPQQTCQELGRAFRSRNPRAKVIEILPSPGAEPMNEPDVTVLGLAGPRALLDTIEAQLLGGPGPTETSG